MKTAMIPVKIQHEQDLYNPFDVGKETLSEELKNYLFEKIENVPVYEQIVIEIDTEEPVDLEQFRTCYETSLKSELAKVEKEMKYNQFKKVRFLLIGIVFIVLSVLFQNQFHTIVLELLSIIGSFAIWEMTNLILVGNRELKLSKLNLKREQQTKIVLKEK